MEKVDEYIINTTRRLYEEGKLDLNSVNPQVLAAALRGISLEDAVEHDSTLDPTLTADPTVNSSASLLKKK